MANIDVRITGLNELQARMNRLSDRDLKRAVVNGTTRTARKYVEMKTSRIDQDMDRPNPFTKRAYDYDRARSNTDPISARVFVRPKQAEYLAPMEFGESVTRSGKKGPIAITAVTKTDKYGGMFGAKGIQRKFLNQSARSQANVAARTASGGKGYSPGAKIYFVQKLRVGGNTVAGLWERKKNAKRVGGWKTTLLVAFLKRGTYRATLNFRRDAERFCQRNFGRFVGEEIDQVVQRRTR